MRGIKQKFAFVLIIALVIFLAACTQQAEIKPAQAVYDALLEKLQFEELTLLDAAQTALLLELDEGMLGDTAAGLDASRYTPDAVIVINTKNQADLDAITQALNAYKGRLLEDYRDYRPDEMFKIEDAKVFTKGFQAVFVISKDAGLAEKTLKDIQK